MKSNVGGIDKILRIVAGLALVAWALMGGPVWAWIGVVPSGNRPDRLVSGLPAARHEHLPDKEVIQPVRTQNPPRRVFLCHQRSR